MDGRDQTTSQVRSFWLPWGIILLLVALAGASWSVVALIRSSQIQPLGPWSVFVPPDQRFRIAMPGRPSMKKQKPPGQKGAMTTYFVERGRRSGHLVGFFDLSPQELENLPMDLRFDGALDGMVNSTPGLQVLSQNDIKVEDYLGREFELEVPNEVQMVVRVLGVNRRFYLFMAFDPSCRANMPIARQFLDSFETNEPPGPLPPVAAADNFHGLVGYWTCDGWTRSDQTEDLTENRLHARLTLVQPGAGVRGQGARFQGPGSFMDLGASPVLDLQEKSGFAIAAWFKPAGLEESTLVSFHHDNPKDRTGFAVKTAHRKVWAEVTWLEPKVGWRTERLETPTPYLKNRWTHFVLMRTPPHLWSLHVDGRRIVNDPPTPSTGPVVTTIRRLGEGFHGALDEVCVFNRALHPKDLAALAGKVPGWVDSPFRNLGK